MLIRLALVGFLMLGSCNVNIVAMQQQLTVQVDAQRLIEAAKNNDVATAQQYIDVADVNYQDDLGNTALHYAARLGEAGKDLVNLLHRRKDLKEDITNKAGQTPSQMTLPVPAQPTAGWGGTLSAAAASFWGVTGGPVTEYFSGTRAAPAVSSTASAAQLETRTAAAVATQRLIEAAKNNDVATAQQYIDVADINYQDDLGNTALHYAARLGEAGKDLVNLLHTRKDLKEDITNKAGQTPSQMTLPVPAQPTAGWRDAISSAASSTLAPVVNATKSTVEYVGSTRVVTAAAAAASSIASTAQTAASATVSTASSVASAGVCAMQNYPTSIQLRNEIQTPDEYSARSANVTPTVSSQEQEIVKKRLERAKAAIEKFANEVIESLDKVPSFGMCFSGGGVRAAYETTGWLNAAQSLGFLDAAQYVSGLSGSTWAIFPWIASGLPLAEFKQQFASRLNRTLREQIQSITNAELLDILKALGKKYYNNQYIGIVDIYGALLAHLFLRGIVQRPSLLPLESLASRIENGDYPFPLATAVLSNPVSQEGFVHRPTFEFSPLSIGSSGIGFIPAYALGRVFENGQSQVIQPTSLFTMEKTAATFVLPWAKALAAVYAPGAAEFLSPEALETATRLYYGKQPPYYGQQLSLSYLMGVWGSAFSLDMYRTLLELYDRLAPVQCPKEVESTKAILEVLKSMLARHLANLATKLNVITPQNAPVIAEALKAGTLAAATIANPTYHMPGNLLASEKEIGLVDGGHEIIDHNVANLAILPLLYRKMDIITICDSSFGTALRGGAALRAAELLARRLKLKFPKINYTNIDTQHASLHIDEEDLEAPIIIYMPGIRNPRYGDGTFDPNDARTTFTATENFTYTPEQAQQLMGLIEFNIKDNANLIKMAFRMAADRKNKLVQKRKGILAWLFGY